MATIVQHSTWREVAPVFDQPAHEAHGDAWEKTDRLFRFPRRVDSSPASVAPSWREDPARRRWLAENDVHTEFLDAGIGCCWFAYRGDEEPVCDDTEDAAIARLAREGGLAPCPGSGGYASFPAVRPERPEAL